MNFGFSFLALIYLMLLFVPNIIFTKFMPKDFNEYSKDENRVLLILERIGEITVTVFALFCGVGFSWSWILIVSILLMVLYELYWIRYFKSGHTMRDIYASFLKIPLPGATLPVFAFLLLGIYADNIFLILATVILGIGHIGIHYNHYNECCLN